MQVCISLDDNVLSKLDEMLKLGFFPPYVKTRSAAISYLIFNFCNEQ